MPCLEERFKLFSGTPAVQHTIESETVSMVQAAALQTLCTLLEDRAIDQVMPYLSTSDLQVRQGAMVGLLRNGGLEGILAAGQQLLKMVDSSKPIEREFAARILDQIGVHSFYQPLIGLLQDDNPQVRQMALWAAGQLKNTRLWPLVLEGLAVPQVRRAAMSALVAGGESVVPELTAAFAKNGQTQEVLLSLVQVCARIGGKGIIALLKDKIDYADLTIRTQILYALCQCGYQAIGKEVVI